MHNEQTNRQTFFFSLCVFIVTLWSAYKNVRDKEKIYKKKKRQKKKEVEKKRKVERRKG